MNTAGLETTANSSNNLSEAASAEASGASDSNEQSSSYGQILRSSSIVGGAQVVKMAIGVVRMKLAAILIGPAGVGLIGMYLTIAAFSNALAGMGIRTSGVRDVAKFHGDGDEEGVARTATTLRRTCWITGILGMMLIITTAHFVSDLTFGSAEYTNSIALLGITVFLTNLADGQSAILQGTRRIADLARIEIIGAFLGTISSVILYYCLGMAGIIPSMIVLSIILLAVSTHYSRRVQLATTEISWRESILQAGVLLRFGASLVVSGLFTTAAAYAIRALLTSDLGLQAAGVYTAAYTLSALFVQFVLQAMGADFYPRLTAASGDEAEMRRLINEQTEIGLLLAFPGLLVTLGFAPLAISLFYTPAFAEAAEMLRWFVLGCMGRVLSWPLAYTLLALKKGKVYTSIQTLTAISHVAFVLICVRLLGLVGASIGFALQYIFYTSILLAANRKLIGFQFSKNIHSQVCWMTLVALTSLSIGSAFEGAIEVALQVVCALLGSLLCIRIIARRTGIKTRNDLLALVGWHLR